MKFRKIHWVILAGVLAALGLSGLLPSYSYVSVTGPNGDLTVERVGPGGIHVKTDDADIRVNR